MKGFYRDQIAEALPCSYLHCDRGKAIEHLERAVRRIVIDELLAQAASMEDGCADGLVDRAEEIDPDHAYLRATRAMR
jgi:hypothetical protein